MSECLVQGTREEDQSVSSDSSVHHPLVIVIVVNSRWFRDENHFLHFEDVTNKKLEEIKCPILWIKDKLQKDVETDIVQFIVSPKSTDVWLFFFGTIATNGVYDAANNVISVRTFLREHLFQSVFLALVGAPDGARPIPDMIEIPDNEPNEFNPQMSMDYFTSVYRSTQRTLCESLRKNIPVSLLNRLDAGVRYFCLPVPYSLHEKDIYLATHFVNKCVDEHKANQNINMLLKELEIYFKDTISMPPSLLPLANPKK